ncbi:hypothetical protein B0H14DRAFT_2956514, partial [Mycena olivaceomarginata]
CALRGVVRAVLMIAPGVRVDGGECYLLQTHLAARGRDKSGAGDGERTIARTAHAGGGEGGAREYGRRRRRQYTAEEPRRAGRRRGDVGCEERQHRVQRVAWVGLGFTPAWCRA